MNEGWSYLLNAPKWHYFRDGRSLCGRWMIFGPGEFEQGNDNSSSNCKLCRRKLMLYRARQARGEGDTK